MRKMVLAMALLCCTATIPTVAGAAQRDEPELAIDQSGEQVVIEIRDGGQAGSVETIEDFLGPNGRHLFVTEANPTHERYYWDLATHAQLSRHGDTYRISVDMRSLDGLGTHGGQSPPEGEYEVVYLEAGGPDAPFWDEGGYSSDVNFEETWSELYVDEWQFRWSPYLSSASQELVKQRFTYGEGGVETSPEPTTQPPTTSVNTTEPPNTTANPTTALTPTTSGATTSQPDPRTAAPPTTTRSRTRVGADGGNREGGGGSGAGIWFALGLIVLAFGAWRVSR